MWKLFVCFSHNRQRFTKGKVEAKGIVSKFTFARRLHSSSDTQAPVIAWAVLQLCLAMCLADPALHSLVSPQTSPVPVVLPHHHELSWLWLLSPNLLHSFQKCPYWWGQCLCALLQPLDHSSLRLNHPSLLLTDAYPGIWETLSQERILHGTEILIFQRKSMLTL